MTQRLELPETHPDSPDNVETVLVPRGRDLGGFEVKRALPGKTRQMVGPFIFFDEMGPAVFKPGHAIDVRPHPHIGLATITYLFDGVIRHRDSLGTTQDIRPGAVNWMVAGKGITHSERTPQDMRNGTHGLSGLQTWLALPKASEEIDPAFIHAPQSDLPHLNDRGIDLRVVLGHAYGAEVPVTTYSDTLYVDARLTAGARLPLPQDHEDRAVYVLSGSLSVGNDRFEPGQMAIFRQGAHVTVEAGEAGAHFMILGGAVADGPRHIWWNFVSSDKNRIEEAKAAWKQENWESGWFTLPPHDHEEFIPLD
ncbi:pirin family protein [Parvularcula sp. LCG005]|uniref:pirin family protein n=1 Tax=Parvularcula sp. LCG005 TaxID=3078805 RepID=UPI0029437562|nr:pirin family protein [Parvularcula sp. LCG005]WOI54693.1 pirin family protein [Parvularcula sp. LCG005]